MKFTRFLVIIFIFFSLSNYLFCDSDEATETSDNTEKTEDEDALISLTQERTDTLKYGIDSEVISLLEKLIDEENSLLAETVAAIYDQTANSEVMNKAVDYFIEIEYKDAVPSAENRIINWENEETSVISSSLRYVSAFSNDKTEEIIIPLIDHENKSLASSALTAIGKCGTESSADILLDYLDDDDYHEDLKPTIIRALGEMKSEAAIDILIDILEDIDEEKSWRWTACEALGKIAHPDALPSIKTALQDKDSYLRSYAVKALTSFDDETVEETLIQSLKDSFWRVRVSAAEALGERGSKNAVEILIYKANKDPEKNVKLAAIKALGKIGDSDSMDFLRDLYKKPTTNQSVRTTAAEIIIENDLTDSIDVIKVVLADEWEKDNSAVLSYSCKFLSKAENTKLEPLFEQMLNHSDVAIKIYGIRGVELNGFGSLKERIEKLTEEGVNNSVRKAALAAVEQL